MSSIDKQFLNNLVVNLYQGKAVINLTEENIKKIIRILEECQNIWLVISKDDGSIITSYRHN